MKRILIIGGTGFVGRSITDRLLLQPDCTISLFNRGVSNPNLYPNIEHLKGDRNNPEDLHQIAAKEWDVVIDTNCYFPKQLSLLLEVLPNSLSNYILISTCSVYDNENFNGGMYRTEEALTLPCNPKEAIDKSTSTYGNRKAECERVLEASGFPFLILRPALIYGPFDLTDRLYYWIHQVMFSANVLLPEQGKRLFSITYINDLVDTIQTSLNQSVKNLNANIISSDSMSISELINACEIELNKKVVRTNASPEFLKEKGLSEWFDIPLWINSDQFTFSNQVMKESLNITPTKLSEGLKETIKFYRNKAFPTPSYGISDDLKNKLIDELNR